MFIKCFRNVQILLKYVHIVKPVDEKIEILK